MGGPAETEPGIEVQNGLIGKQEHAVAPAGPIPEHLLHQPAGQAPAPVAGAGHDGAQLDVMAPPALQQNRQAVHRDVGQSGIPVKQGVGQVGRSPIPGCVPVFKGQAEDLRRQGVEGPAGFGVRHDVFMNLICHFFSFYLVWLCHRKALPPETWGLPGRKKRQG